MTVNELIEALKGYPQDMHVVSEHDDGCEYYSPTVREDSLWYRKEAHPWNQYQENPFIRVGQPCEWNRMKVVVLS